MANQPRRQLARPQIEALVRRLIRQGVSVDAIQQLLREVADEYND